MNITIFIGCLKGGGAEKVALDLATHLSARHFVTILQVTNLLPDNYVQRKNITIRSLDEGIKTKNPFLKRIKKIKSFKKFLKSNSPDIYIGFLPENIELLLYYNKFIKCPIVFSERSNPKSYSFFHRLLLKRLSKRASGAVFQTDKACEWYNLPAAVKTIVIPNASKQELIDLRCDFSKNKICACGRLEKEKGFDFLIKSFKKFDEISSKKYDLIIFGEGRARKQLEELIVKLNLEGRVFMPGYCNDVATKMSECSIFISSSRYEGMSNALIEAMSIGLSCIATDCEIGGNRFLVKDNQNGLLIEVDNERQMVDALLFYDGHLDIAKEYGSRAKVFCKELSKDKIYGTWEAFIKSLV